MFKTSTWATKYKSCLCPNSFTHGSRVKSSATFQKQKNEWRKYYLFLVHYLWSTIQIITKCIIQIISTIQIKTKYKVTNYHNIERKTT